MSGGVLQSFFLIFCGAAVLATAALYSRQPIMVAYIALGALLGPSGLSLVTDVSLLEDMASIGIMFLLFLLGLDLQPSALFAVLRQATGVTLASGMLFFAVAAGLSRLFDFSWADSVIIGMAAMNSSTIIGIKLLPTTVLHHRHTGELMIGLLLIQDLVALFSLLMINAMSSGADQGAIAVVRMVVAFPLTLALAWAGVRYLVVPLIARFDRFHEYVFLLAIGWCLGGAATAHALGLSHETGAFLAGIALASSPIAQYIALSLKPLRDFFLVLFFFALGAKLMWGQIPDYWAPVLALGVTMVALKPVVFRFLLGRYSESPRLAWDVGFRLGQFSEFAFLIAYVAEGRGLLSGAASTVIQAAAILTFVASTYIVILNFPNPIAIREDLRRD